MWTPTGQALTSSTPRNGERKGFTEAGADVGFRLLKQRLLLASSVLLCVLLNRGEKGFNSAGLTLIAECRLKEMSAAMTAAPLSRLIWRLSIFDHLDNLADITIARAKRVGCSWPCFQPVAEWI